VLDDDHSQHKPGILGGGTPVALEVLVTKPGKLFPGNYF